VGRNEEVKGRKGYSPFRNGLAVRTGITTVVIPWNNLTLGGLPRPLAGCLPGFRARGAGAGGGSLVFSLLSPDPLLTSLTTATAAEPASWTSLALGTLAAGLVFFGLDALIGPTLMRLKYGLSRREVLTEVVLPALPSDALAVATVLVAVPVAAFRGPLTAVILLSTARRV
jgi:hypothetical protein